MATVMAPEPTATITAVPAEQARQEAALRDSALGTYVIFTQSAIDVAQFPTTAVGEVFAKVLLRENQTMQLGQRQGPTLAPLLQSPRQIGTVPLMEVLPMVMAQARGSRVFGR